MTKKVQKQERKIIKNERRCRNGVPKSTQTRKDKSDGKYTKPCPYIFSQRSKDAGMDEALYTYHHFYPSLFYVLFGTPFLHLLSFLMIFLSNMKWSVWKW